MHLADTFILSDLQCIQALHVFISMCVPWESNPQPFYVSSSFTKLKLDHSVFASNLEMIIYYHCYL